MVRDDEDDESRIDSLSTTTTKVSQSCDGEINDE